MLLRRLKSFFMYAWEVGAVTPSPAARVRFVLATCWLLARVYAPILPNRPVRVSVLRRGRPLSVTLGQYPDLEVLRELYLEGEYPENVGVADPEVIVDLGANIGLSLLDFRLQFPNARLVGVEPDPIAFKTLQMNVAGDPKIEILPFAIGASDGVRTFYSSAESVVSGFERTRTFQEPLTVVTKSLDSLMRDLGVARIDVLKIDVEGAEDEILGGFTRLDDVRVVVGELHPGAVGMKPVEFFRRYLPGFEVESTEDGERSTFLARRYTAALA